MVKPGDVRWHVEVRDYYPGATAYCVQVLEVLTSSHFVRVIDVKDPANDYLVDINGLSKSEGEAWLAAQPSILKTIHELEISIKLKRKTAEELRKKLV